MAATTMAVEQKVGDLCLDKSRLLQATQNTV